MQITRRLPLAFLAALATAGAASAQDSRNLDVERFRPAPDRYGFIGIPGTRTPGSWAWNASLFLNYSSRPLGVRRLDDDATTPIIRHRLGADVIAQLGILGRIALVLDVPVVLWQEARTAPLGTGPPIATVAVRDPYASIRVRVLGEDAVTEHQRHEGEGLALSVATTVPLGLEHEFAGEGNPQLEASVIGDFHFLDFGIGGIAGYRHRFAEPTFLQVRFWNEIFFGLALKVPTILVPNLGAIFEARVTTAVDDEVFRNAATAFEGEAGLRWAEGDLALTGAAGMGFNSGLGTPGFRAIVGVEFAPRIHDVDADGIPDGQDECVRLPEDQDGYADEDGCPDPDNDGDLIPDEDDRCPDEAAAFNEDADEDGCTDPPPSDRDGDGIPDDQDSCPAEPEDADDWQDEDGCPDPDDDGDGILDVEDRCRRDPEDADGFEDHDGCPDPDHDENDSDSENEEVEGERPDSQDQAISAGAPCGERGEGIHGHQDGEDCPGVEVPRSEEILPSREPDEPSR